MPMYTPTTTHVLATDDLPAVFRPGNQANLEPSAPANFSATQDMLPGMGNVRSGSPMATGLAPNYERGFARAINKEKRIKDGAALAISHAQSKIQSLTAIIQQADHQGNESKAANARRQLKALLKKVEQLQKRQQIAAQVTAKGELAPWQRGTALRTMQQTQAIRPMRGPATPNPLDYEPVGYSAQKGRAKILAMQANIQPVQQMHGFMDLMNEQVIPGVPNWTIAAGASGLILLMVLKKKKRG